MSKVEDFAAFVQPGASVIQALNPRHLNASHEAAVAELLAEVAPRTDALRKALDEKEELFREMSQRRRDVAAIAADAQREYERAFVDATTEGAENPATDFEGLAQRLHGLQLTAKLAQDTLDYITFGLLPDLEEATLTAVAALFENTYLESCLLTASMQIDVLRRTKMAFGDAFGSTAVITDAVLALERSAQEMQRQSSVAKANRDEYRARRASLKTQRLLSTGLTYSETLYAQVALKPMTTEEKK